MERKESGTVFLVAGDCGKTLAPARAFQLWRLDTFIRPHCTSVMHLNPSYHADAFFTQNDTNLSELRQLFILESVLWGLSAVT
jgi:hypothetical protein